jgi:DNA mismatch repair protein MutS
MQLQYNQIKEQHPHDIVLFRLGDFYEAFNDDAKILSKVLGLTLTGRGKDENRMPMAGIPHHALNTYLPKIIKAGLKVVMVDQLTEPKPGELVQRDITKIYTPGTLTDENTLSEHVNNYLVSIYIDTKTKELTYGIAIADVSTGKLEVFQTSNLSVLKTELQRISPAEVIAANNQVEKLKAQLGLNFTTVADTDFLFDRAYAKLLEQFQTSSLKGFGIEEMRASISALGALISYLQTCYKALATHLRRVSVYNYSEYMQLDESTIRNLELVAPASGNDFSATVFSVLNQCGTNMGKRKLYDWLLHPYLVTEPLQERWDTVSLFAEDLMFTTSLREKLAQIADIERIVGRIGVGSAGPRDLLALKESLIQSLAISEQMSGQSSAPARFKHLAHQLSSTEHIQEVIDLIDKGISADAPVALSDGGVIADGYNAEIDELRALRHGGKSTLAEIQAREVERTGITSLKVSYNKVFGYYIEITKTHADKVPADYIRKQTLTNAERYITQELKEWEDKILTSEERLARLELELFVDIRNQIARVASELLVIAGCIAELDVLSNFGYLARNYNFCKPELSKVSELRIRDGRHLVVERLNNDFTPNDVEFDKTAGIIILTGPNMSGKSTYIRQVALITLLAQIGCFVPAKEMKFSLVDRIFTRVGASDNLSRGESTFMVEMHETANILNNATDKSLIILDEVGRGTSTYDGVAIAWSVVEYIQTKLKAKTLFATHYHELIALAEKYPEIKNYHVKVLEEGGTVLFQHKIAPGSTSRSYGVHVAKMAGVPNEVVEKAEEILEKFETRNSKSETGEPKTKKAAPSRPKKISPQQLGLM